MRRPGAGCICVLAAAVTIWGCGAGQEIREMRFYEDDRLIMILEESGDLRVFDRRLSRSGNELVGRLTPDNVFHGDAWTAEFHDDGTITIAGETMPYRVGPDASLQGRKVSKVRLEEDGTLSGEVKKPGRVEGATTTADRRRAMFVMLLVNSMYAKSSAPPERRPPPLESLLPPPEVGQAPSPAQDLPPVSPLPNREAARAQREDQAIQALRSSRTYEQENPGDVEGALRRYRALWDEYGETRAGSAARECIRRLEKAEKAREREQAAAGKRAVRDSAREVLERRVTELLQAYEFQKAQGSIEDFMFNHGETRDLSRRYRQLGCAHLVFEDLIEGIRLSDKELAVTEFRSQGPVDAHVESADMAGVSFRVAGALRREPWSWLKPREVDHMAAKLGLDDALNLLHRGLFLQALGLGADSEKLIASARSLDKEDRVRRILDEIEGE